jgi:anthranilate phosphoribosyltransferase
MRAVATPVPIEDSCRPLLDTCGTGANCVAAFNISTVSAFVAAGAGVRIAKHGNRSISSKCGSADVLEAMGVRTLLSPEEVARAIRDVGIGFMFAPVFHAATRSVQPIRLELKMRTFFNYLGPLTNPAGAEMQVAGTWSDTAAEKVAGALARLGVGRAFVVHGSDGLGELTITGASTMFSVQCGKVERLTVSPEDFGFTRQPLAAIQGGDAARNREIAESVLEGRPGAARDIVLMNSALALIAAGCAHDYRKAVGIAAESIDSGAARSRLDQLREAVSMVA